MILDTFDGKSQVIGNFTVTQALVFAADKDVARLFRKGIECSLYDGLYLLGEELLRVTGFEGRDTHVQLPIFMRSRSEERRVGKECRSRWSPYH